VRRILVIQNKRIGDVILIAPALHALRLAYPAAKISVVLDGACSGVDELLPSIEPLYFHKGRLNFHFWGNIILRSWDLCFEFTGTDRGVLVAWLSKASMRITYSSYAISFARRLVFNRLVESDVKSLHTAEYHLDLIKGAGIRAERDKLSPILLSNGIQSARELLSARSIGANFAVIHPGTARPEKMWSVENWVQITDFLNSNADLDVVLTGGSNFMELEQISHILSRSSKRVASLAGETTLATLAAIIAQSRIYVGVDTGAAHIADALGIPSVVLFGSTNPLHWGPRSPGGRAVGEFGFSSYPHNFPKSSTAAIPTLQVKAAIVSVFQGIRQD
jgi:ADP-heptose:LPS heptosyltransferase